MQSVPRSQRRAAEGCSNGGIAPDGYHGTAAIRTCVPSAKEFDLSLTAVAAVFTIALWLRLVGATAAGWMADRMGRKAPLMISIRRIGGPARRHQ